MKNIDTEKMNKYLKEIREAGYICTVTTICAGMPVAYDKESADAFGEYKKYIIGKYKQEEAEKKEEKIKKFRAEYELCTLKPFNMDFRGQADGVFVSDSLFEAIIRRLLK